MSHVFSKKYLRGKFFFLVGLALICLLLAQTPNSMSAQTQIDLADISVGVYNGAGADEDCATALYNLLAWMGSTMTWVNQQSIHNGILNSLDLIAFPGGSPDMYGAILGEQGIQQLRLFVSNGGSYFGICGGGMFATRTLDLCQGYWVYPIPGIPDGVRLVDMDVNQASTSPDLSTEPATYQVLFWGSHYFMPTNADEVIPILTYSANDGIAMCVSRYGYGTTFICGPHPEFEEGSDRDGTTRYDYLDDPDSEWGLLRKVTQWLIDESADTPPPNPIGGILIIVGVSTVIAVVGIVFILRRKRASS
ncbi:MAG: BPL-N domain-containing protein [Promethearchaeota archaeon]